jgi:enoyl-[acyl-carrier protein] reductase II
VQAAEGATQLSLKKLTPVRLLKNSFFEQVRQAEEEGASAGDLQKLLGRGRAKKGMYEGDLEEGELEIGQVSALIDQVLPAREIVENIWKEFLEAMTNPIKKTNFKPA